MGKNQKPLICKILGVEVDEEWFYNPPTLQVWARKEKHRIRASGSRGGGVWEIYRHDGNTWEDVTSALISPDILYILEHPDGVEHKHTWTETDVEDARALRHLFPSSVTIDRYNTDAVYVSDYDGLLTKISNAVFPSLKPGESADLDAILAEDANSKEEKDGKIH